MIRRYQSRSACSRVNKQSEIICGQYDINSDVLAALCIFLVMGDTHSEDVPTECTEEQTKSYICSFLGCVIIKLCKL